MPVARAQLRLACRGIWAVLGLWATLAIASAQSYTAVDIGSLGGSNGVTATAINSSGTVVGYAWITGNAAEHAFMYSGGVMTDLGTLGGVGSYAYAINDSGMIVGSSQNAAAYPNTATVAFSYSSGVMTSLGTLGGADSQANGINSSGTIVGFSYLSGNATVDASGQAPIGAFMFSNGTMTYLGHLGGPNSLATGINDAGTVVGTADINAPPAGGNFGTRHAFSYANGVMTDLGTLSGSPGDVSLGYAINNGGTIVGMSGDVAFRYSGGSMASLGVMGSQYTGSSAEAINNAGTIVGFSFGSSADLAFVYLGGEVINLNSVGGLSKVTYIEAAGVNGSGQIVANASNGHAYLLTPNPGTSLGNNTANGYLALEDVSIGRSNTAVGAVTLAFNTTGSSNTAIGSATLAGGSPNLMSVGSNTAIGALALTDNTSGSFNTAIGTQALTNNQIGSLNVVFGYGALMFSTDGAGNTAMGESALGGNANGSSNSASGYGALTANSSGMDNTADGAFASNGNQAGSANAAFGEFSLANNNSGSSNVAMGSSTLYADVGGSGNIAVGSFALGARPNGSGLGGNNIALGIFALGNLGEGSGNIGIGYYAGSQLTTGNSNIMIGNVGVAGDNATIRVGTQGSQLSATLAGIYETGVAGSPVVVDSSGQLGVAPSSARFKEDVRDMGSTSDAIFALRPVTFRYRLEIDPAGEAQFGLVAEEVAKISPDLVTRDATGQIFTVRYDAVNAMLLNEFRKQHEEEATQSQTILQLQDRVAALAAQDRDFAALAARIDALEKARSNPSGN